MTSEATWVLEIVSRSDRKFQILLVLILPEVQGNYNICRNREWQIPISISSFSLGQEKDLNKKGFLWMSDDAFLRWYINLPIMEPPMTQIEWDLHSPFFQVGQGTEKLRWQVVLRMVRYWDFHWDTVNDLGSVLAMIKKEWQKQETYNVSVQTSGSWIKGWRCLLLNIKHRIIIKHWK